MNARMLLLLACLAVSSLHGGVVQAVPAPPSSLTLGLLLPLTGPNSIQYASVNYLVHLGIDAINADPSILPNTHLELAVRDSASDQATVIASTVSLVLPAAQGGAAAVAIIGELFSGLSVVEVSGQRTAHSTQTTDGTGRRRVSADLPTPLPLVARLASRSLKRPFVVSCSSHHGSSVSPQALTTKPYVVPMISPYASSTVFPLQHATNFPWFVRKTSEQESVGKREIMNLVLSFVAAVLLCL
jgi:hypothetical protein